MRKLPVVLFCRTPARLPATPDTLHVRRHPGPARGAYALSSRNVGRETMDARRALDESALMRTAKSCGSDIPTLISSWRRCFRIALMTGARKPGPREEPEGNRNTIVQGMPECFGLPVVTMLVCFDFSHARLRVRPAPGIPCALRFSREGMKRKPRADRQRDRDVVPIRHACGIARCLTFLNLLSAL
jgi:hypothetical protein